MPHTNSNIAIVAQAACIVPLFSLPALGWKIAAIIRFAKTPHSSRCGHFSLALAMMALVVAAVTQASDAASPQPATQTAVRGSILCAYWRELPGDTIADLTTSKAYPDYPDEQVKLNRLEIRENQPPLFATLIRGYIYPPQDGLYTFYIAGNHQCELWLSTDDGPANKKLIASVPQWSDSRDFTADPTQTSAPLDLKSSTAYYIEVRHKAGEGDNNLSVAWNLPDGIQENPIPGERLSPAAPVIVPPPVVKLPRLPRVAGLHHLNCEVNLLSRHVNIPLIVTLPPGYQPTSSYAAVVFLADVKPALAADDSDAPLLLIPPPPVLPADLSSISLCPQWPDAKTYESRITTQAIAAVIGELCRRYPIDPRHLGIVGSESGSAAAFQIAAEMPGFFASLAVLGPRQVTDKRLPVALASTHVRLITDIGDGYATDCANRMNDYLASLTPKPQIVYLGPRQLGQSRVTDYCLAQTELYDFLTNAAKTPPKPSKMALELLFIVAAMAILTALRLRRLVRLRRI